jgi:hypothetical protein
MGREREEAAMKEPGLVILGVVAVGFLFVVLPVALTAAGRYRQPRVLICPEAGRAARVTADARHVAVTAALGREHIRVAACTLWPARRGCAEICLEAPAFEA